MKISPKITKLISFIKEPIVYAYKEEDKWYIKDLNGYSKDDNLLVMGISQLFEFLAGNYDKNLKYIIVTKHFHEEIN